MIDQLAARIQPTGIEFDKIAGLETLFRRFGEVVELVTINRYPLSEKNYLVELFIGLRHEKVESTIKPFVASLQNPNPWQPTLMVPQGYFVEGNALREEIRDEADITIVIHQWVEWLEKTGLVWLKKHHDLPTLFEFYRANQQLQHHPLTSQLRLLAMAKIVEDATIVQLYHNIHQKMQLLNLPESYTEQLELMAHALGLPIKY